MTSTYTEPTRQTVHVRTNYTVDIPGYGTWIDERELADLAYKLGSHFFEPATMRGFRSRVHDIKPAATGWWIITSEKHVAYTSFGSINEPRRYTLRFVSVAHGPETDRLQIDTVGEFQQYASLGRARTALKHARAAKEASHATL